MKNLLLSAALFSAAVAAAAGGNLIVNGEFRLDGAHFPPYWMPFKTYAGGRILHFAEGGPKNGPFVRLTLTGDSGSMQLHQTNLQLVKGERYRIAAWVRTRGVEGKRSGVCVGPGSFPAKAEVGIFALPANQPEWRRYEREIVMPATEALYPYYCFALVLDGAGELDVADVSLEALTEKGRHGSRSQMEAMEPHLVPVSELHAIDSAKPVIEFFWVGRFPGDPAAADCLISFNGRREAKRVPFSLGRFAADLSGVIPEGASMMQVKIVSRASGAVLAEELYPVRSLPIPQPAEARKLNNLVTEICRREVAVGEKVTVANPRYGFLFFRFAPEKAGEAFRITLDGKPLFDETIPLGETVRSLEPGVYTLVSSCRGTLTVRLIPDVITFALMTPRAPGNGIYDLKFAEKYMIPGLTTINIGAVRAPEYARLKALGRQFLENYGVQNWSNPNVAEDDLARMVKDRVFRNPDNDGTTMDEAECWYPVMLDPYAWALRNFENPNDKLIVTYITGPVSRAFVNVLSAAANTSKGRGCMVFEEYLRDPGDLEKAKNIIAALCTYQRIFKDVAPGLYGKAGIMVGNFSAHPNISLAHSPATDYKVYLDMQYHAIANDPSFEGLRQVGYWGTYAADEETVRWCFALTRHYAFEGKREMLSEKYGFRYLPGHLRNGDFTEGLKHWQSSGDVAVDRIPGFGKKNLNLHGSFGAGDVFALFTRGAKDGSTLEQEATGLTKGKLYTLHFYSADLDDVLCDRRRAKRVPIDVELAGAEIVKDFPYTGNNSKINAAWPNTRKIIFRAQGDKVKIVFSDGKAKPGTRSMLNYVALRPYFEPSELK